MFFVLEQRTFGGKLRGQGEKKNYLGENVWVCCPGTLLGAVCVLLKGLKDGLRKAVVFLGLSLYRNPDLLKPFLLHLGTRKRVLGRAFQFPETLSAVCFI